VQGSTTCSALCARAVLWGLSWDDVVLGAPGRTRTCNLLFRRQLLCPLSYRGWWSAGYRNGSGGRLRTNRPRDCQVLPSMVGRCWWWRRRWEAAREVDGGQGADGGGGEEAAGGHGHAVDGGPAVAVGGAAGDEGVGADDAALRGEPGVGEAGVVAAQGVVEAAGHDGVEVEGNALAGDRARPARSAPKVLFIKRWWPPT
jgi:hypothetical protein